MSTCIPPGLIDALKEAESKVNQKDIDEYLWLRSFVTDKKYGEPKEFEQRYARFYAMNSAGLTPEFKRRYFDRLFALGDTISLIEYIEILADLYEFPRIQRDKILAASFVSKMVAIRDERYPIYDKYVSMVFGIAAPSQGGKCYRSAVFVQNIEFLQHRYLQLLEVADIRNTVSVMRQQNPKLSDTHGIRLLDFLVWQIGRNRLLERGGTQRQTVSRPA